MKITVAFLSPPDFEVPMIRVQAEGMDSLYFDGGRDPDDAIQQYIDVFRLHLERVDWDYRWADVLDLYPSVLEVEYATPT